MIPRLALADLWREWSMFACYAIALAAVLAPLLVLYSLRTGVVDGLTAQLRENPANREITVIGNRAYDRAWLDDLAERPEVGFLAPRTRSIAASIYLAPRPGAITGIETAELEPTGPDDPVLRAGPVPTAEDEIVVTHPLARALDIDTGAVIAGSVVRQVGEARQRVELPLRVVGVLPPAAGQRRVAYGLLPLLEAVEAYRDGLAVERFDWDGESPPDVPRPYAGFRLYAASLVDVGPLADALTADGLNVRANIAQIETVQRLDRNLTQIFAIIASLGAVGYLLSLGANLWSNVERKRKPLSILGLLGLPPRSLIAFPLTQAAAIAAVGLAIAFAVYGVAEGVINALFQAPGLEGRPVSLLHAEDAAIAAAGTIVGAIVAATVAGWRATRVEPAEGMRDV